MTEEERQLIIGWLAMWTNWNNDSLNNMSDQKLLTEYERHNKLGRG